MNPVCHATLPVRISAVTSAVTLKLGRPIRPWLRCGLISLCVLAQAGCAGPQIVRWSAPAGSPKPPSTNLDAGLAYADAARDAYQQAVADHVKAQGDLSNVLLGTGALATVLAAAKVHRDALLGTAFFGATAYAFGNQNLSKQRALVHLAGVDAINCAKRAVSPLAMSIDEQQGLDAALSDTETGVQAVNKARGVLRQAIPAGLDPTDRTAVDAALAASATAVETAQRVLASGRRLSASARSASAQLRQTVDRIDSAVVRASMETIPDLSAVPKVIAGLSGFAASFAPGAGIDIAINNAMADRAKALSTKAQSGRAGRGNAPAVAASPEQRMDQAMDALETATDALLAAASAVQSWMVGHEAALVGDALKDCGVTDVAFPLRASSERIAFAGGAAATKSAALSGGTKPYVVELQDSAVDGVTLKAPAPFESRLQISITKDVKPPQTFSVLVMDSSNPMRTLVLPVEVGIATPAVAPGPAAAQDPAAITLEDLANLLNKKTDYPADNGVVLILDSDVKAKPGAKTLTAALRCKPLPVADALVKPSVAAAVLIKGAGLAADHPLAQRLQVTGPANCIAAGG